MCGIVGVLASTSLDSDVVARMRDQLTHRGPDAAGLWRSPDGRLCLGHRRLAIIDLTPTADQPWLSSDSRFVVVYNGEIYNFRALRAELAANGSSFRSNSDTEVLVEAYRQWGADCLPRLSGMFAFAIWDSQERALFCARDRAGEKPFHYAVLDGSFVFASELKGIRAWPAFRPVLNQEALIDFLTLGMIADSKSIWDGVLKLPPGHCMTVRFEADGAPKLERPKRWWDFHVAPGSATDWHERFLDTLQRAAAEMAIADVPLGTFLSGGVDSSSVVAALTRGGAHVRSFTIGFDEAAYDERPWARQVAHLYHTDHSEKTLYMDHVDSVFDQLVWHFDEPFNDYSYLPTYYVCRAARESITVALSGDGADEIFAGYRKYQRLALRSRTSWAIPRPALRGIARVIASKGRKSRTLLQYASTDRALLTDMLTLGFSHAELCSIARGPLAQALKHYGPQDAIDLHLAHAPPERLGLVNSMRYLDLKLTLGSGILVKVDRASMAVSLEVRPVYLHRDLLALAATTPQSLLADPRHAKKGPKKALEKWLPKDLLRRRKMGFALPLGAWLRADGQNLLRAPTSRTIASLLDPGSFDKLLDAHQAGRGDNAARLHSLAFLDRWSAKWLN